MTPTHSHIRVQLRGLYGGFTLIELLVTITIFGFVLSSLVVGLRSGIGSWRNLQRHQAREAAREQAIELLRSDFESVHIINEDNPALTESTDEILGDALSITVLGRVPAYETDVAFVWATVSYRVGTAEDSDEQSLLRAIQPMAGSSALAGSESEIPLLEGVRSVHFGYLSRGETQPLWQEKDSLPAAVEVHIEFDSGPALTWIFPLMTGMLNAGAQS